MDVVDRLCQLMFYSAYSLQVAALALFLRGFGSTFVSSKAVRSSYHFPGAGPPQTMGTPETHRFHGQVAVQETSHLQYTGWTGSAQKLPQAPQPSQLVANPEPSFSDLRVLALKIKLIEALESTWPAPLAASPLRSPIARWKTSTTLGLTWAYIGRLGPCGPALEALEIRDRDRSYVLFCGTMPER